MARFYNLDLDQIDFMPRDKFITLWQSMERMIAVDSLRQMHSSDYGQSTVKHKQEMRRQMQLIADPTLLEKLVVRNEDLRLA